MVAVEGREVAIALCHSEHGLVGRLCLSHFERLHLSPHPTPEHLPGSLIPSSTLRGDGRREISFRIVHGSSFHRSSEETR